MHLGKTLLCLLETQHPFVILQVLCHCCVTPPAVTARVTDLRVRFGGVMLWVEKMVGNVHAVGTLPLAYHKSLPLVILVKLDYAAIPGSICHHVVVTGSAAARIVTDIE